jgi:antitoxin component YwqK of YwqJK toxin-antitoxin module
MKPYLIIIFFAFVYCSCQDSINDIGKRNQNWVWWTSYNNNEGEWVSIKDKKSTPGDWIYTLFYFNGNIREKGKVEYGIQIDTVFGYNLNGQLEYYKIWPDTVNWYFIKNGIHTIYYSDGIKAGEGIIQNHKFGDKWTEYFKNGNIDHIRDYTRDTGWFTEYYENGKLKDSVYHVNGFGNFVTRYWYENGKLAQLSEWKRGGFNGVNIDYYENGQLKDSGTVVNGKLNGKLIGRFDNGNIKFIANYKEDKKEGKEVVWYKNGDIKGVGYYKNGLLEGEVKRYDENGNLTEDAIYKDGDIIKKKFISNPAMSFDKDLAV